MISTLIVTQDGAVLGDYLDVQVLAMLGSALMPIVVSFLTKRAASDALKSVINIVATAAMAVLALWINPGDVEVTTKLIINTFILSFVTSLTAYKGLWKPLGVTDRVESKTATFGLGRSAVEEDN